MARTPDMFQELKPKRKAPQKLMHVCDAGGWSHEEGGAMVRLLCKLCKHETEWLYLDTVTEAKRGKPCPNCNSATHPAE